MASYGKASSQALGIVEILQHVSSYLETDDLICAIQVCKYWHTSLRSQLFCNIRVSYIPIPKEDGDVVTVPSFSEVRANSHKIQSLTIIHRPPSKKFVEYLKLRGLSNLERFTWKRGEGGCHITRDHWRRVLHFLRANGSTLKEINIEYYNRVEILKFWKVLAQHCTSLQRLRIQRVLVEEGDLSWFWLACRKLVSLEMDNVRFVWPDFSELAKGFNAEAKRLQEILDREEPKVISGSLKRKASEDLDDTSENNAEHLFQYMKRLYFYGNTHLGEVTEVLQECPRLESFHASTGNRFFIALTLESAWPNLHSISLPQVYEDDKNMAELITLLNPHIDPQDYRQLLVNKSKRLLKVLQIPDTRFGRECWNVLRFHRHTETLEHLNIKGGSLKGYGLIAILTSCPRLKSLVAPILHAAYITETRDQPWVCLGLERLIMGLELSLDTYRLPILRRGGDPPTVEEMQQDCLNQLCRLRRLKSLVMADRINGEYPGMSLSLKLDDGLGQLDGLSNLEEVSFIGSPVEEQGVEWMAEHWRRLRRVRFNLVPINLPKNRTKWWTEWCTQSSKRNQYSWH